MNSHAADTPDNRPTEQQPHTAEDGTIDHGGDVVLVRRGRRLNLGGAVVIALLIGALVGLVWGLIARVDSLNTLMLGVLNGALFIGGALALIAVIIDMIMDKRTQRGSAEPRRAGTRRP